MPTTTTFRSNEREATAAAAGDPAAAAWSLADPGPPPLPGRSAVDPAPPIRGTVTEEAVELAKRVRRRASELQRSRHRRLRRIGFRLADVALLLEVGSERETPSQLLAAARKLLTEANRG